MNGGHGLVRVGTVAGSTMTCVVEPQVSEAPVNTPVVRTLRISALLCFVALAGVGCSNPMTSIRENDPPWHYWIAPLLGVSVVGAVVLIGVGYLVKVVIPKYRGTKS